MKTNTDLFEKVPVPKAVATMAVPTMISMLIFVLNHMFGLEGVIYAQPTADYLSIVVAILICTHLFRTVEHKKESIEID